MTAPVDLQRDSDGVATVTLSRATQANALNAELVDALLQLLAALAADPPPALVFRGEGKGFCGGFDLDGLEQQSDGDLLLRFVRIEQMLQAVAAFPALTIACAHQFAWGAGADLFAACRVRLCDPATRFSFPGARFGLVLGTGRLRQRLGPAAASRLLGAAGPIDAPHAREAGLATALVERGAWNAHLELLLRDRPRHDAATEQALAARLHPQENAQDLAALVTSAARPGLQARLLAYRDSVKAGKKN